MAHRGARSASACEARLSFISQCVVRSRQGSRVRPGRLVAKYDEGGAEIQRRGVVVRFLGARGGGDGAFERVDEDDREMDEVAY